MKNDKKNNCPNCGSERCAIFSKMAPDNIVRRKSSGAVGSGGTIRYICLKCGWRWRDKRNVSSHVIINMRK